MSEDKFRVEIRVTVVKVNEYGATDFGNHLEFNENLSIDAGSFLQVAGVLGQFHALAEEIKAKGGGA